MAENEESENIKFYKPNLRFIIPILNFHCPKKLFNEYKKTKYYFKVNCNFYEVINYCKKIKRRDKSTWINQIIVNTYEELHKIGVCHSIECYEKDNLIGGLYGVHLGSCFFGESMFSIKKNTSKFCLLYLLGILKKNNFLLLDSQFYNEHLLQFGAYEINNNTYETKLNKGLKKETKFIDLNNFQEAISLLQSTNHRS